MSVLFLQLTRDVTTMYNLWYGTEYVHILFARHNHVTVMSVNADVQYSIFIRSFNSVLIIDINLKAKQKKIALPPYLYFQRSLSIPCRNDLVNSFIRHVG
jgi:uncharacterized protein YbcV (DUF1398 family)